MSVTVVKGRSGSGKSRFLMRHIKKLIEDPFKKVLVLVPGQLTFEMEKAILDSCEVKGIFGLEVMSIQRLAYKIIEDTGSCTFMTNAQKAVMCSRAVAVLGHPFRGVAEMPGFEVCFADLVSRLKSYNQTPDSLRDTAGNVHDAALRDKLIDTADVYEQYLKCCGTRLDASDMYAVAADRADGAAFLQGAHVVIDGLDSYAPAVMGLLARVIALSCDTTAAFRSEGRGRDAALFASEKKDMDSFIAAARKSGKSVAIREMTTEEPRHKTEALKFLEANLYAYPTKQYKQPPDGIALFEANSIAHEVDILVSEILAGVKQGRRYRDMAVVAGGAGAYLPPVKAAFSLAGIPYFIDERRALSQSTLFDFVYQAMCAAAGDKIAAESYVASRYAPLTDNERYALMRYAARYAQRGWHYWNPFWRGDDAAEMEALRHRVMMPLFALEAGMQSGSAREQVAAVAAFLSVCGAADKLTAFCSCIDTPDTRAEHAYFSQVYEKITQLLAGLGDVLGEGPVPPQTLCDLFKTGCDATRIAVIPPTTDAVVVVDISVARLKNVDVLFAVGLHDGVWPAKDDGPGILSASERNMLASSGVDIGVFDIAAEKLKTYTALVRPRAHLHLSYNIQSGTPSIIVDRMRRIFTELKPQKPDMVLTTVKGMAADVLGAAAQVLRGRAPDDDLCAACAAFLQQPGWVQKARAMLLRTNAALPLGRDTAAALFGGRRCSATRIETYKRCPYRHFLSHGLRAEPMRDYANDRLDIGTYMHLALDLFAQALLQDDADIKALGDDEITARMDVAAELAAQQHAGGKLLSDERLAIQYAALRRELLDTALRIKKHFVGTDAVIYASEQPFRGYTVGTALGDVEITGKIDRIDTADGYFRVVDYKSSVHPFRISDYACGIALQLPVYIAAAGRLLGTEAQPAGGYYMRIGDVFKDSEKDVDKAARMTGISLNDAQVQTAFNTVMERGALSAVDQAVTKDGTLNGQGKRKFFSAAELDALLRHTDRMIGAAAAGIFGGDTTISPVEGACEYCDYAGVCRISDGYDGNTLRPMEKMDKEQLLEVICDER